VDRAYVTWTDVFGATRLVWYSFATGGTLTPFGAAVNDCSNAVPSQTVAGTVQVSLASPSTDLYPNVVDSAVLTFVTAYGNTVGVVIPAFKESLYLADNQTVDPAQPLVIALVAATIALPVVDSFGNPVVAYVSGLRQRRGY
jgi:hypothetical protein